MSLLGWACRPRPTVIGHHVINTCVHTWRDLHWGPELATSQLVAASGVLDRPWQGFTQDDEMLALLQESILLTGQEDHEPQAVVEVKENLDFSSYIHRGQQQGGKGRLPVLQNSPWGVWHLFRASSWKLWVAWTGEAIPLTGQHQSASFSQASFLAALLGHVGLAVCGDALHTERDLLSCI